MTVLGGEFAIVIDDARNQHRVGPGHGVDVRDLERGQRDPTVTIGGEELVAAVRTPTGIAAVVVLGNVRTKRLGVVREHRLSEALEDLQDLGFG